MSTCSKVAYACDGRIAFTRWCMLLKSSVISSTRLSYADGFSITSLVSAMNRSSSSLFRDLSSSRKSTPGPSRRYIMLCPKGGSTNSVLCSAPNAVYDPTTGGGGLGASSSRP